MPDDDREKSHHSVRCAAQQTPVSPPPSPLVPEFYECFSSLFSTFSTSSTSSVAGGDEKSTPIEGGRERPKIRWGLWSSQDDAWMRLVQQNYEKNHRAPRRPPPDPEDSIPRPPLIPLTIHHIWLGSPLPEAFTRLRESWLSRHSSGGGGNNSRLDNDNSGDDGRDGGGGEEEGCGNKKRGWELRLWTDDDVDAFGLENREAYEAAANFGQKSDIFRYEILLRHGGLYVDVDFLCIGSFDDLHRRYQFYTGVSNTGTFELNNGLVGCCPGHPVMRDIVNRIQDTCSPSSPPFLTPLFPPSYSPPEAAAVTALSMTAAGSSGAGAGEGTVCSSRSGAVSSSTSSSRCDAPVVVGDDPLSALLGALGGVGAPAGAGGGRGGGGLLAGLLGGEDRARLEQAVRVEPGSATETIVKTGPGVFTRAVMTWMAAAAADIGGSGFSSTSDSSNDSTESRAEGGVVQVVGTRPKGTAFEAAVPATVPAVAAAASSRGSGSCGSNADSGATAVDTAEIEASMCGANSSGSAAAAATAIANTLPATAAALSSVMVLPPSYLYPIPNNAAEAKDGRLVGDGIESGVRERAGDFFSPESLAAHLWARSWQSKDGTKQR